MKLPRKKGLMLKAQESLFKALEMPEAFWRNSYMMQVPTSWVFQMLMGHFMNLMGLILIIYWTEETALERCPTYLKIQYTTNSCWNWIVIFLYLLRYNIKSLKRMPIILKQTLSLKRQTARQLWRQPEY